MRAKEVEFHKSERDWRNAALSAGELADVMVYTGQLNLAREQAQSAVDFANRSNDPGQMVRNKAKLGNIFYKRGMIDRAKTMFSDAECIQRANNSGWEYLFAEAGWWYSHLLLDVLEPGDDIDTLEKRVRRMTELNKDNTGGWLVPQGLALLLRALISKLNGERVEYMNKAIDTLIKAGNAIYLTEGLIMRASLYRMNKNTAACVNDLGAARRNAEEFGMPLYRVDVEIVSANISLDEISRTGRKEERCLARVIEGADMIERMVSASAYNLRQPEWKMIKARTLSYRGSDEEACAMISEARRDIERMGRHSLEAECRSIDHEIRAPRLSV